jgi:hypothetical protein
MLVPEAIEPEPSTFEPAFQVTALLGLLEPVTEALNWSVPPLCTDWFAGLTPTPVTTGTITLTRTLPDLEGSAAEVAIT